MRVTVPCGKTALGVTRMPVDSDSVHQTLRDVFGFNISLELIWIGHEMIMYSFGYRLKIRSVFSCVRIQGKFFCEVSIWGLVYITTSSWYYLHILWLVEVVLGKPKTFWFRR